MIHRQLNSPSFLANQLTSVKGVLVVGARLVGNLDATSPVVCILKQVDVGALVKSVVARMSVWRRIEVVNVSEAVRGGGSQAKASPWTDDGITHSVATFSSPA